MVVSPFSVSAFISENFVTGFLLLPLTEINGGSKGEGVITPPARL